jgi:hypothetical protein
MSPLIALCLLASTLDVDTLEADLTPNADGTLTGALTFRGVAVANPTTVVRFQGERLTVTSARVDGKTAAFSGSPLAITLPSPAQPGDTVSVELAYTARPLNGTTRGMPDWIPLPGAPWDRATVTLRWILPQGTEVSCAGPRLADEPLPGKRHRTTCRVSDATLPWAAHAVVGRFVSTQVAPGITVLATHAVTLPRLADAAASVRRRTTLPPPPGTLTLVLADEDVPSPGWEPEPRGWVTALLEAWLPPSSLTREERNALVSYLAVMVLEDLQGTAQARLDAWPAMAGQPALRALHTQRARLGDDALGTLVASVFRNHATAVFPPVSQAGERPQVRVEPLPQGTTLAAADGTVSNWTARVEGLGVLGGSLVGVGTLPAGTVNWVVADDGWWTGEQPPRLDANWLRPALKDAPEAATRARALQSVDEGTARAALESDPSSLVREVAARMLARDETPSTVRALEAALDDPEPRVQAAAADALCTMGDVATVRRLGKLAGAPGHARVRLAAARSLGCHVRDAGDLITRALKLDSPGHAVEAAVTSGMCRADAAHAQVLVVLQKGDAPEFIVAAQCVDASRARAAVLRAAWARLADPNVDVRLAVLSLLERLRAEEARKQLTERLLQETHPDVRARLQQVLSRW